MANWKLRFFVLTPSALTYYAHPPTPVRMRWRLDTRAPTIKLLVAIALITDRPPHRGLSVYLRSTASYFTVISPCTPTQTDPRSEPHPSLRQAAATSDAESTAAALGIDKPAAARGSIPLAGALVHPGAWAPRGLFGWMITTEVGRGARASRG